MPVPRRQARRARRAPALMLFLVFAALGAAPSRAEEAPAPADVLAASDSAAVEPAAPAAFPDAVSAAPASEPASPRGSVLAAGFLPDSYGQEGKARENPLRRFEIVALGSYPIMLFYTGLGFDLSAYIGSGYDPSRAPWPFKNEYSAELSDSERLVRLGTAALASVVVAGVDAAIREAGRRREERAARRLFEGLAGSPP